MAITVSRDLLRGEGEGGGDMLPNNANYLNADTNDLNFDMDDRQFCQ